MTPEDPKPVKPAIPLALCSLPRGCTIYAAVSAAVIHGLDLAAIGSALDRTPREVRRLLTAALVAGVLDQGASDALRVVLGVADGRKIASYPTTDQADQVAKNRQPPPDQADQVAKNRPPHASARAPVPSGFTFGDLDQLSSSSADTMQNRMKGPPPIRAAILRDALKRHGWDITFSAESRANIERWTGRLPLARVEAIAEAFASDSGALFRARSVPAMFYKLLPTLLDAPAVQAPRAEVNAAPTVQAVPAPVSMPASPRLVAYVDAVLNFWRTLEENTPQTLARWDALRPALLSLPNRAAVDGRASMLAGELWADGLMLQDGLTKSQAQHAIQSCFVENFRYVEVAA
jgi:hypothetical protein